MDDIRFNFSELYEFFHLNIYTFIYAYPSLSHSLPAFQTHHCKLSLQSWEPLLMTQHMQLNVKVSSPAECINLTPLCYSKTKKN